jgi:hypothetical protein
MPLVPWDPSLGTILSISTANLAKTKSSWRDHDMTPMDRVGVLNPAIPKAKLLF